MIILADSPVVVAKFNNHFSLKASIIHRDYNNPEEEYEMPLTNTLYVVSMLFILFFLHFGVPLLSVWVIIKLLGWALYSDEVAVNKPR